MESTDQEQTDLEVELRLLERKALLAKEKRLGECYMALYAEIERDAHLLDQKAVDGLRFACSAVAASCADVADLYQ